MKQTMKRQREKESVTISYFFIFSEGIYKYHLYRLSDTILCFFQFARLEDPITLLWP